MQMCACLKEHMRKVIDYVSALFAWFARPVLLAGIAKTATSKACNETGFKVWGGEIHF